MNKHTLLTMRNPFRRDLDQNRGQSLSPSGAGCRPGRGGAGTGRCLAVAAGLVFAATAGAGSFTAGNLAVLRVGTGTGALGSAAAAVFIDEYTPSGSLVQSVALPTASSGSHQPFVVSGTATSEGMMNRSTDGRYLVMTGYAAVPATAGVSSSLPAVVPRVIARMDFFGEIDTTTALGDSGGNARSAASVDGSGFWMTSSGSGVRYAPLGGTSSTALASSPSNLRYARIFDGQLYVSAQSGSWRLASAGSGLPVTGGQTMVNLPGFPTAAGSPNGFFFADLDASEAGVDTLYVADDSSGAGILKYSLVAGIWMPGGNVVAAGVRGLTGMVSGSTVELFAVSSSGLYHLTDTSGYDGPVTGPATLLATAGSNTAFRSLDWAPLLVPVNHAPVAVSATYHRAAGMPLKIGIDSLLASSASDPDGDGVSLVAVGASAQGAALTAAGGWILYEPAGEVDDSFSYTIADSHGLTASATIHVTLLPPEGKAGSLSFNAQQQPVVNFTGIPGFRYTVERSMNLQDWSPLQAVTAPENGAFSFTDTDPPANAAYYRMRYQP